MSSNELGPQSLVELKDISLDMMVMQANTMKLSDQEASRSNYSKDEPCSIHDSSSIDRHSSDESSPGVKIKEDRCAEKMTLSGSAGDDVSRALIQRKQPLMELVSSEEGYVRRLKLSNTENNIVAPGSLPHNDSSASPPVAPEDLAARWRIIWGNWIQLYEWHSAFLEKLVSVVESDPDRIPKLFIDSRARLRSIYSKYCENHRKAALIAEQYRDFFEELRIFIGDKEDVVSHLMQPVQRIMRYQLPIAEILKYTQRACSPDLLLWKKTLEIMKEIPKDTQLILEVSFELYIVLYNIRVICPLVSFQCHINIFRCFLPSSRKKPYLKSLVVLITGTSVYSRTFLISFLYFIHVISKCFKLNIYLCMLSGCYVCL
ncbi:unnamed protein product [Schistosoma margrebowiei]|uniref:Uncharacterized protein n=1 Tax=Schistosoma margrebowiei TaxID=48269 RepID=A0A183M2Y9_9TREM|nr:unnamed protein product [Schistosoma margrebowiei]